MDPGATANPDGEAGTSVVSSPKLHRDPFAQRWVVGPTPHPSVGDVVSIPDAGGMATIRIQVHAGQRDAHAARQLAQALIEAADALEASHTGV